MKPAEYEQELDKLLSQAIHREDLVVDFDSWKQEHRGEIQKTELEIDRKKTTSSAISQIAKTIIKGRLVRLAVAAAIVGVAFVGILRIADWHSSSVSPVQDKPRDTLSKPADRGRRGFRAEPNLPTRALAHPTIDALVARSTLIIRGKYLEKISSRPLGPHTRGDTWNIEVSRVFYGELTGNIITAVDLNPADPDHPDPGTEEHILFLRPMRGQLHILAGYKSNADLDAVEREILEVIENGTPSSTGDDPHEK